MAPIIDYIRGEYVTTLLKGRCDPRATEQMIRKLTKLPGAASSFPAPSGGCLQTQAYLDEVYRTERKLGSRLDSNPAARDLSLDALPQERGPRALGSSMSVWPEAGDVYPTFTELCKWMSDERCT